MKAKMRFPKPSPWLAWVGFLSVVVTAGLAAGRDHRLLEGPRGHQFDRFGALGIVDHD